ncbi:hypothetical protein LCGC14_1054640 [marine sediment metagenome]|uniref:Uncharacterized protein n=1 Tax=marine sediment metagenome TaxID=412755 RepID=A0A0F9N9P7_9ZZZZ
MKITGAKWTPQVNMLLISCLCGNEFLHRSDRWKPKCPKCRTVGHLKQLREDYAFNQLQLF